MTEEQSFLSAIMVNPDDRTAKLVYADWLEDRGDPRAEYVRLKVAVETLTDGWEAARDRLRELEPNLPATWLAQLDGPVWCVAGNIAPSRPAGPGGVATQHGTRLFKPNAKVYLADHPGRALWSLQAEQYKWNCIRVVGRHRKSLDWIGCILRTSYVTNWRVELVYQPGALARLKKEGWAGFGLTRGQFTCPADKSSPEAVRSLLELLSPRLGV